MIRSFCSVTEFYIKIMKKKWIIRILFQTIRILRSIAFKFCGVPETFLVKLQNILTVRLNDLFKEKKGNDLKSNKLIDTKIKSST